VAALHGEQQALVQRLNDNWLITRFRMNSDICVTNWIRSAAYSCCAVLFFLRGGQVPSPQIMTALEESKERWDVAAQTYEKAFIETLTGKLWRSAVWAELDQAFVPGSTVLEMNCGTGVDAIHLAKRGIAVLACDISSAMIERARSNAAAAGLDGLIEFRVLPTENLEQIPRDRRFAGAFSNFSGLNCVGDLVVVSASLAARLDPGSIVLLCMLGPSSKWERLWRIVQRRLDHIERRRPESNTAQSIQVTRYSYKEVAAAFRPYFDLRSRKGIGIFVPPAFVERTAARFPNILRMLGSLDRAVAKMPFFRDYGGCVLLEFERTVKAWHPIQATDSKSITSI
jgi:SAM-dependent methyltransferase